MWFTGGPGQGKSTTAQLLAKDHGYVYYEADCFSFLRNPYIPLDEKESSLAVKRQPKLNGPGLEERREVIDRMVAQVPDFFKGNYVRKLYEEYYTLLCEDITKEKKRIGGDWAVAQCVMLRDMRNIIRFSNFCQAQPSPVKQRLAVARSAGLRLAL